MRDRNSEFWISHDHGKTWKPPEIYGEWISAIFPNEYFNDMIIFQTDSGQTYFSLDRGKSIQHLNTPGPLPDTYYSPIQLIQEGCIFHSSQKDWLIWFTARECQSNYYTCIGPYLTQDRGSSWRLLRRNVQGCRFVAEEARGHKEKLIYCEEYMREDIGLDEQKRLVTSDDFPEEDISTPFDDIAAVEVKSEFTTVTVRNDFRKPPKIHASVDGKTFAMAQSPANTDYVFWTSYAFLDSPSHSQLVFHLTTAGPKCSGIGSLFKSNSNSTSFVLSINDVNLHPAYFVDLEKMEDLNGVRFANIVSNAGKKPSRWPKKLKTMATHDDGATWDYIPAPPKDAYGVPVKCNVENREKCSLHLYRRFKPSAFASSPSATGLMVAVGNVGEYLGDRENSDTYITRDGGLSWHAFLNGPHLWEYGDQGSVILLVGEDVHTNSFFFTLDEGRTWEQYQFTNSTVQVVEISSVLNSQTLEFLLWARTDESGYNRGTVTFNVDFTGLRGKRKCDPTGVSHGGGDFYLWEPRHPARSDSCLFGHVAQYRRKRPGADCYVGVDTNSLHAIERDCQCTREDYECAFNSEPQPDGSCALIPGFHPVDQCKDPDAVEWTLPARYRRTTITTCEGGLQLDIPMTFPCPGREEGREEDKWYQKLWAMARAKLFLVIPLVAVAVAAAGWWFYSRPIGRYGRMRLLDSTRANLWSRKEDGYADAVAKGSDSEDD